MQIQISRVDLASLLKRASEAISTKSDGHAWKAAVLFVASGERVTARATDGILNLECSHSAEVKKPGRALLPYRRLSAIVSEMPPGLIELSVNDKLQVTVKSLASKRFSKMQALEAESFPPVLAGDVGDFLYAIEGKTLLQAASEVGFGIDRSRCDGALLAPLEGARFRLMSLSGPIFAVAIGDLTRHALKQEIVLPRVLLEAARAFPADSTEISVHTTERRVTLVSEGLTVSCDLLVGGFPSVWQAILDGLPKDRRFRVGSDSFFNSVKAVSAAAEVEGAQGFVQIDIHYQNSQCIVSTRQSENHYGEDELSVQEGAPGECVIHVDAQQVSQALRAFSPAEVDVYYDVVGAQQAIVFRNESLLIMLLPVNEVKAKS
jgi:DNA polymerase III sliding clamp (beta) subunit (PCNA family)